MTPIHFSQALPECRYESRLTPHHGHDDWQRTLLDTLYKLPEHYAPSDLVPVSQTGYSAFTGQVRAFVIPPLTELMGDAAATGVPLEIQSAYRSYSYQASTFNYWRETIGEAAALASSARAGHSEHQLGTAVDFRSKDGPPAWDLDDWAETPAGAWVAENAHRYGFIMSYPRGKREITCYIYELWHYRYVGVETAQAVTESGLTLREWLWQQQ
jgi:D-alanyl-D-alanine carboxypeptidase